MANKKTKKNDDWEFLPKEVQKSIKLSMAEKNVVATLCASYLNFNDYALKHDGWFYISQKEIEEYSGISHRQLNRVILNLVLKKVIERKSGKMHRPTHYRLHPKIVELLPKIPNGTQLYDIAPNGTQLYDIAPNGTQLYDIAPNGTQDKIRLVKIRKDYKESFLTSLRTSSIINNSTAVENGENFNDFPIQQQEQEENKFDMSQFYHKWANEFEKCKTEEELTSKCKAAVYELPSDVEENVYLEKLQDLANKLKCRLHFAASRRTSKS